MTDDPLLPWRHALLNLATEAHATQIQFRRHQGDPKGTALRVSNGTRDLFHGAIVRGDLWSQDPVHPFDDDLNKRFVQLDRWLARIHAFALTAIRGGGAVLWTTDRADGPSSVLLTPTAPLTDHPTIASLAQGVSLAIAGMTAHQRLAHPGPLPVVDGRPLESLLTQPLASRPAQAILVRRGNAVALVEGRNAFPVFWSVR